MLATGSAAADRTMVVVIDASGSMQTIRPSDNQARFDAAIALAAERVGIVNSNGGLSGVAVYMFHGTGITAHTAGFVTPFEAQQTILNNLTVTSDLTPLAGSLCDTIDIARASGTPGVTTDRFIEVYSDGGENNTNPMHACCGSSVNGQCKFSTSGAPYDADSWQNKVFSRAKDITPIVTINPNLFTNASLGFGAPSGAGAIDPEASVLAQLGRPVTPLLPGLVSDADIFSALAAATGGNFQVIVDSAPLPVFGDVDGDFDVDRDDAILLARRFGTPVVRPFDLNASGAIGFADYAILLSRFGAGSGTPVPDPYVQAQPVSCTGDSTQVVIDGKVIEDGGITISANEKCQVIIRNSLIVSGSAAIRVHGGARLTVDNSIIVGEGAWISGNGSTTLSAANSVFHGAANVAGALKVTDRGGTVFE
ncbi:MAG TPA: hypothetical protein VN253_01120 [Kofleriaceae bacterium]|nr:hypothetical protein [Kofleriaceae bacterium]